MSWIFLALFLTFLSGDLLWGIAAWRTFARWRWLRVAFVLFAATMGLALASMLLGRLVGIRPDTSMPTPLLSLIFIWHFIGLPLALIATIVHRSIPRKKTPPPITPPSEDAPADSEIIVAPSPAFTRRDFLSRATAVAVPAIFATTATGISQIRLSDFRVRRLTVPTANLPSGIDGLTIAHVSDTHLGRFTTGDTFRQIVKAVNDLDADLVLQTGDLINHDQRDLPAAADCIREIRARHGQFLCEGNHDLIEGRDRFRAFMRDQKLPLLVDEIAGVQINGVQVELLGLPWVRAPRGNAVVLDELHKEAVTGLAATRSRDAFPILLAHHPHAFDAAQTVGIPLTLSGHTHGGQLNLTHNVGFGAAMYRYWSGLYQHEASSLVVSNGTGNWFPLRFNAPAEILHLTLKRA